ncbi:MAG: hypothetical protein A3J79_13870 [Elusimicrobia bacterium RIFOXYB2_FULL_62_6]|nr:MAG: hypothetical protein A3J79_13870 [Elusimicrobia bacterium RIFOXYB2_FULL_62_6]
MLCMAVPMVPWPVAIITSTSGSVFFISPSAAMPSMPGIMMSIITRSNFSLPTFSMASSPQ